MNVDKQRGDITGKGFMPGQSGNPADRPQKRDAWADAITEVMESKLSELTGRPEDDKITVREALTRRMELLALEGNAGAAQWLADQEALSARRDGNHRPAITARAAGGGGIPRSYIHPIKKNGLLR